ncbi:hypothetical protein [Nocardia suismassiliense]|uniref:hypothetical protein n=1 Tax=Nocardia suismassiliense TaxID=2077092 RepID=UPI000D1DE4ED|nr:hypothetical protein [Nocardia suismassiliense]
MAPSPPATPGRELAALIATQSTPVLTITLIELGHLDTPDDAERDLTETLTLALCARHRSIADAFDTWAYDPDADPEDTTATAVVLHAARQLHPEVDLHAVIPGTTLRTLTGQRPPTTIENPYTPTGYNGTDPGTDTGPDPTSIRNGTPPKT